MTSLQGKTITPMMHGSDITAQVPAGTGKTCAFGIPVVESVNSPKMKDEKAVGS